MSHSQLLYQHEQLVFTDQDMIRARNVKDAHALHFVANCRAATIRPSSIHTEYSLTARYSEFSNVFSLCIITEQSVAYTTSNSPVLRPTASGPSAPRQTR